MASSGSVSASAAGLKWTGAFMADAPGALLPRFYPDRRGRTNRFPRRTGQSLAQGPAGGVSLLARRPARGGLYGGGELAVQFNTEPCSISRRTGMALSCSVAMGGNDMAALTVTKLHPSLGAEIAGIDLSQPIDAATREALSQALAEHLALVFRDQRLTPPQYLAAASAFGPPMRQHYSQHNMPDYPDIGLVWHRNGQRPAERWHTDHTNRECPPAATLLYGVEIPSAGGGTSVANMRAAYAALPEDEQAGGLTRSARSTAWTRIRPTRARKIARNIGKPIVHPMVRTHPVHGSPRGVFPRDEGHVYRGHDAGRQQELT